MRLHNNSLGNTATTYSPLFIRSFAKNHKLQKSSKGIKKRQTQRFELTIKKPVSPPRKPLAQMAQVLSPGAVPEPVRQMPKEEEWRENLNVRLTCKDCRTDPPELYEDHEVYPLSNPMI